jgi:pyrrolidone-carboxylate peptidase
MSETFLVTGFEPFGEHRTNSSWDAIARLRPGWPDEIISLELPVDHRLAHDVLRRTLDERAPRVVLCTGLAKGNVFRVERSARRPSLLGVAGELELLEGRWPWHEMHAALEQTGARVIASRDAGQYVCESTYWTLLAYAGSAPPPEFAAFLHVPHESADNPLDHIAAAIASVVQARRAALATLPDPSQAGHA